MEINETQNTNSDDIISGNNFNSKEKEFNSNIVEELSLLTDSENKLETNENINKLKTKENINKL